MSTSVSTSPWEPPVPSLDAHVRWVEEWLQHNPDTHPDLPAPFTVEVQGSVFTCATDGCALLAAAVESEWARLENPDRREVVEAIIAAPRGLLAKPVDLAALKAWLGEPNGLFRPCYILRQPFNQVRLASALEEVEGDARLAVRKDSRGWPQVFVLGGTWMVCLMGLRDDDDSEAWAAAPRWPVPAGGA